MDRRTSESFAVGGNCETVVLGDATNGRFTVDPKKGLSSYGFPQYQNEKSEIQFHADEFQKSIRRFRKACKKMLKELKKLEQLDQERTKDQ